MVKTTKKTNAGDIPYNKIITYANYALKVVNISNFITKQSIGTALPFVKQAQFSLNLVHTLCCATCIYSRTNNKAIALSMVALYLNSLAHAQTVTCIPAIDRQYLDYLMNTSIQASYHNQESPLIYPTLTASDIKVTTTSHNIGDYESSQPLDLADAYNLMTDFTIIGANIVFEGIKQIVEDLSNMTCYFFEQGVVEELSDDESSNTSLQDLTADIEPLVQPEQIIAVAQPVRHYQQTSEDDSSKQTRLDRLGDCYLAHTT